jgi:hypothetical protein
MQLDSRQALAANFLAFNLCINKPEELGCMYHQSSHQAFAPFPRLSPLLREEILLQ